MTMTEDDRARGDALARSFLQGNIDRRAFLRRAGALGGAAAGSGLLSSLIAACGGSSSTSSSTAAKSSAATGKPTRGGTLKAALTGEPDSLDPAKSQIYTGAQIYDNVFSKLVDIDENQKFYGVLATKWDQVDDKTWRFTLRDGVKFHNGEPFGPADVKYTFERILDKKTASGYAPLYEVIDEVVPEGTNGVTFKLKTAFGPFLTNLANNGEIVNRKAIEQGSPARKPVGTGPFKLVKWTQGQGATLERNPDYFVKGQPYLDGIEFRFLLVDQSRVDALRSGELDWADAVPLQLLPTLSKDPTFNYISSPIAGIPDFLAMNVKKPPFDKPEVRQAIAYAVDREEIRKIAYFGAGESGGQEVPSKSKWFGGPDPYGKPDVEKAKQLLQQAGAANLTIEYLGLPQYPELLKTGEVVREQLKAIGVTMNIKQVDVSVWFDRFSKGDYQITSAYQERTIDPDNFYSLVLKTGGPINATGYSSPDADDLIVRAARETDDAKRKELYIELRQLIWKDVPLLFVHYETLNYLMRKPVVGSTVNPTLELRLGAVGETTTS
jgi:peptide/nickel transport system substrate-binding protein